jgi:hypothetical protein
LTKPPLQLLGKLVYVSYTTDSPGVSVGRSADDLALIFTWLTYAY